MKSLLILGAGGFGHMIKETAQALGYEEIVFLDDMVKEDDVIGMCCDYVIKHEDYPVAVAAFGNNKTRRSGRINCWKKDMKFLRLCIRQLW